MPDLFPEMDQPQRPKGPPAGAVTGLACAEPGCSGKLCVRWSYKLSCWFYGCSAFPGCSGTLPADKTGAPRGNPRTKALQAARAAAHRAFDTLWKDGHTSRGGAYAWLQRAMGLDKNEAHMYRMNEEQAERVVELVEEKGPGTEFWIRFRADRPPKKEKKEPPKPRQPGEPREPRKRNRKQRLARRKKDRRKRRNRAERKRRLREEQDA